MSTPVNLKNCCTCGESKDLTEFAKRAKAKDGHQGICRACATAKVMAWAKENKEQFAATQKRYRERHKQRIRDADRRYRSGRPPKTSDYHRAIALKRRGLTIEKYDQLLAEQRGLCAICCLPNSHKRELAVDHDHRCCTGRSACDKCRRGLLCIPCNTALNALERDQSWHEKALAYLSKYGLE